jgi:hypothetical protein
MPPLFFGIDTSLYILEGQGRLKARIISTINGDIDI